MLAALSLPSYATPVGYSTLRNNPIAMEPTPPVMRQDMEKPGGFAQQFTDQPPLIPHGIRGYQQTRAANMCLMCHKAETTPPSPVPAIGASHFTVNNGEPTLSFSRYFCVQCHVPQADVQPLVKNNYQSAEPQQR